MNKGKIVQIIGPVVDIEFADKLPAIYNALTVEITPPGAPAPVKLTLEVQQHLGDNWLRAVAMRATEGHKRAMEITDHGAPIRARVARQLGYKSVKYLHKITAVDSLKHVGDGRGSAQPAWGYSWYAGI